MCIKSHLLRQYMSQLNKEFYQLKPVQLGCEVRGVDLKTENRPEVLSCSILKALKYELHTCSTTKSNSPKSFSSCFQAAFAFYSVIEKIKEDVTKHRLLIFKDQGIISGDRHVEISKWFGELESTFYKHPKSPHPDVFRVSNDGSEGCTGVGRTGWHIDGSFQAAPFAYSLYHMVSVPKEGATSFAPLTEIVEGLDPEKRKEWDRLWMISDRRSGPVHPLIYKHPKTKKEVLCFHLGMTEAFVLDYGLPTQRNVSYDDFRRIINDINHEFVKNNKRIQYKHNWEAGDFIISDNLSVGHEATPETQIPRSKVGLRVLHRTTIAGTSTPSKD